MQFTLVLSIFARSSTHQEFWRPLLLVLINATLPHQGAGNRVRCRG